MKDLKIKKKDLKKFLLEVPEQIWEKWKDTVPRSISINNALIELLRKESSK
jgi:phage antirepressor YoqD-like protein